MSSPRVARDSTSRPRGAPQRADFGRALAGFEVPEAELAAFGSSLARLGYAGVPAADNAAYPLFLAHRS